MKLLVEFATVCACLLGAIGAAQAGEVDALFGNTVVLTAVTADREIVTKYYYQPDGTVTLDSGGKGTWEIRGAQFCTSLTSPETGQTRDMCSPLAQMANAAPGATWQFSPTENVTVKGELVAGR